MIGQYQAAFRETITVRASGQTGPSSTVRQAICQERPAAIDPNDPSRVVALLRRYQSVRLISGQGAGLDLHALEGVTLRCARSAKGGSGTDVLSPGRTLGDQEALFARTHLFTPDLSLVLPARPVPVGDSWVIPKAGVTALLGRAVRRGVLAGRLSEVRDGRDQPRRTAFIDVDGEVLADVGIVTVKARLRFAFDPAVATRTGAGAQATLDAPGSIVALSLVQRTTLAERHDARAGVVDRELVLERREDAKGERLALPR